MTKKHTKTKIPNIIMMMMIGSMIITITLILIINPTYQLKNFVNGPITIYGTNTKQSYDNKFVSIIPDPIIEKDILYALGETIFNDKSISKSGNTSCSSCHKISLAGTDGLSFSKQDNGSLARINTPTIFNLAGNNLFLSDGSASTFASIFNAKTADHFNTLGQTKNTVTTKISNSKKYRKQFGRVFKGTINIDKIVNALNYYIFHLTSPNSKFDLLLGGQIQALSEQELEGYMIFKAMGCINCHHGQRIGGNILQKRAVYNKVFADNSKIQGLYSKTKLNFDRFLVKVPSLRNIEITSPYLYDGSVTKLLEVVKLMYKRQLNRPFTKNETDNITLFLKTLTSEKFKADKDE